MSTPFVPKATVSHFGRKVLAFVFEMAAAPNLTAAYRHAIVSAVARGERASLDFGSHKSHLVIRQAPLPYRSRRL
jgi:hypothetical protein